jgi:hypothetical protein
VLAIDKTICNISGGGKLSLEPIVVSYGLIAHDIRKTPAAMRVLGFINTTPFKERAFQPKEVRPDTPHLQINFILRESGYLDLQESGLK